MTTNTITINGKVFTAKDITYDDFTREELVSEIMALKSKNDKRVKALTKRRKEKLDSQYMKSRMVDKENRDEIKAKVRELQEQRDREIATCNPTLETILAKNKTPGSFFHFYNSNDESVYGLAIRLQKALENNGSCSK